MKNLSALVFALALLPSSIEAEPVWHRFVSPTGFSVEYPLGWRDPRIDHTVHATQLIWSTEECPSFSLKYIRPDRDHDDIPYFPGQFLIYEMEIERSTTIQDEAKIAADSDFKINKIYKMALNNTSADRCSDVTVIRLAGMVGPYGQSHANKPWLENMTDMICSIGNRQFRFSLDYANNDERSAEFNSVFINIVKSFRLIPVKHKSRYCALALG